ncbi:hypothetical protein BJX96DRAFT_183012 [Aspergillus floccosus]
MSVPLNAPSDDAYWQTQRRKVRKGTHSCWECKRRKMKCRFDPRIASASCNGCRRRGSPCISQEYPEDLAYIPMGIGSSQSDGTARAATPSERPDPSNPLSSNTETSRYNKFSEEYLTTTRYGTSQFKHERLSRLLHGFLPSRKDIESLCRASSQSSILSHELLTTPYNTLYQNGLQTPDSLLALFLQHLPPDLHNEIKSLAEPPRVIMERLAEVAIYHVTTNEELIGSVESLECIMLESLYQVNIGNLRRSWVAGRRAMSVAQLMGFHRSDSRTLYKALDPKTKYNPQLMWLRINILDRQLCLLLGLPQGCADHSMASEPLLTNDCPMGHLEHLHCVVMSRILAPIDLELQKAAGSLPSKWWLIPKLNIASTDLQAMFWDTRRLVLQICHYNILNQLHLPYMLRPSSTESKYEYSRITCVNASREVLSRYISLRSFNRIAYSCRTVDFLALTAATALLLAHMDSHRDGADNLLANQYLSDRGMIEQVQEHMSEINKLNADELSAQSVDLLKALLAIDMENGNGRVSVREAENEGMMRQDGMGLEEKEGEGVVRVHIPYFGIIRIARELPTKQQAATTGNALPQVDQSASNTNNTASPLSFHVADSAAAQEFTAPFGHRQQQEEGQTTFSDPGLSLTLFPMVQGGYPELAAGGEDWVFQGVDMAFFESIMRNSEGDL